MQRKFFALGFVVALFLNQVPFEVKANAAINSEAQFVKDEIVIKYKKASGFNLSTIGVAQSHDEEDLAEAISNKYNLNLKSTNAGKHYQALGLGKLAQKANKIQTRSLAITNSSKQLDAMLIKLDSEADIQSIVNQMNNNKLQLGDMAVEAAYPNYLYEIDALANVPNDPSFPSQYALNSINARSAWTLSEGETSVVAIIDTGVDFNHPDLAGNIWINEGEIPNNGIDDDRNGFVDDVRGFDFVANAGLSCLAQEDCVGRDNNPMDVHGHGTHVAGIVAAIKDNRLGISGIAPKAKIMPLRAAFAAGLGAFLKSTDIAAAVEYAVDNGADVINMSFAGAGLGILDEVLQFAHDSGVVLVAAAGNSNRAGKVFPAALDTVIGVAAIDSSNNKANFSNHGDWIDIAAPGVNILSTLPGANFGFKSGTSMASPYVAGVAALIKATNSVSASPNDVKSRILAASTNDLSGFIVNDDPSTNNITRLNADIKVPLTVSQMTVPREIILDEGAVVFSGTGSDSQSDIIRFEWRSSLDGFLSNKSSFTSDELAQNLSVGIHTIFFRVGNRLGQFSEEVSQQVIVTATRRTFDPSDLPDDDEAGPDQPDNDELDINLSIKRRNKRLVAAVNRAERRVIASYKWTSDLDGEFSDKRKVHLSNLRTKGLHTITLEVTNFNGDVISLTTRRISLNRRVRR